MKELLKYILLIFTVLILFYFGFQYIPIISKVVFYGLLIIFICGGLFILFNKEEIEDMSFIERFSFAMLMWAHAGLLYSIYYSYYLDDGLYLSLIDKYKYIIISIALIIVSYSVTYFTIDEYKNIKKIKNKIINYKLNKLSKQVDNLSNDVDTLTNDINSSSTDYMSNFVVASDVNVVTNRRRPSSVKNNINNRTNNLVNKKVNSLKGFRYDPDDF